MLPFGVGNSLFSNSLSLEEQLFNYIDEHQDEFVKKLKEWVAVESDSQQPRLRAKVIEMVEITAASLEDLGATVTLKDIGIQQLSDGKNIALPPVILANFGDDPQKPTVCFYGHVDVMPAKSQDGWKTDPFDLTEIDEVEQDKTAFLPEADPWVGHSGEEPPQPSPQLESVAEASRAPPAASPEAPAGTTFPAEAPPSTELRRSSRASRRPAYLDDYAC